MENTICNFRTIQNPNRRYANTVNLVFFRAIPLTKNFQKYVDGLKQWKEYMKDYPDSQLQVFVDQAIAEDGPIMKILGELNARVILFECPEFLRKDGYHKGLFGTMVRFFPMFDVNTHALRVAHIQELEPDIRFVETFKYLNKVSVMTDLDMIYTSGLFFQRKLYNGQPEFQCGYFPWIIAGRFMTFKRIPFRLLTDYLKEVIQNKKFFNLYTDSHPANKSQHGNFSFGVDEQFLNLVYMHWLIKHNCKIGIYSEYSLAYPIYFRVEDILEDNRSKAIFDYILDANSSVKSSIREFDRMFYSRKEPTEHIRKCSERFYEMIEKYPTWLGSKFTTFLLTFFKGVISMKFVAVCHGTTLKEIRDVR